MSSGFEDSKGLVNIVDKVTTTDIWGLSTTEYKSRFMYLAEIKARDLNKQAGKTVVTIESTTVVPQRRKI